MIKEIQVRNFKSILNLNIKCNKVNIFIGEPNTGKSNILESIGICSSPLYGEGNLNNFVRLGLVSNIFYNETVNDPIMIIIDNTRLTFALQKSGNIIGIFEDVKNKHTIFGNIEYDYTGKISKWNPEEKNNIFNRIGYIKFYRYGHEKNQSFSSNESFILKPPHGNNLATVLKTNKELRKLASDIFQTFGLKIVLRPQENKIEIQKELDDSLIISLPYHMTSDTLRRIIFYLAAIESNREASILFEEPESHASPYYTKFLAERIAFNSNKNQYFITTHNPYFLLSVLEKTKKTDISIFLTYFKNYSTKIKKLSPKEITEILNLDKDVFFNFNQFL